jgi:hypothetical protein
MINTPAAIASRAKITFAKEILICNNNTKPVAANHIAGNKNHNKPF